MTTRTAERTGFLFEILITAVEGGIGYWSQIDDWKPVSDGTFRPTIVAWADMDPGEPVTLPIKIDDDLIARGIAALLQEDARVAEHIQDIVRFANRRNDSCPDFGPGDIDAEVADCVIQFGVFGKLVYG